MKPSKVNRAKHPVRRQKMIMAAAGLDPNQWLVVLDDGRYMHLVEKYFERRQRCIIDIVEKCVVKSRRLAGQTGTKIITQAYCKTHLKIMQW